MGNQGRNGLGRAIPNFRYSRRGVLKSGLAASLGAGALSTIPAVGASASRQDVSGSLRMWVYPLIGEVGRDEEMWAEILEGFSEEYPDIDVNVEIQPWDRRVAKLSTAFAAGVGPDVWYVNIEDIPNHAESGRLVPVTDLLSDEEKDDYFEQALTGLSYKDELYALPILMTTLSTCYNTDVFEQAGVSEFPWTWDGMLEAGPSFKEQGLYLTTYEAADPQANFYPLLWQAGGEAFSEDGSPAFNSPEGVEALSFAVTLVQEGYSPESATSAERIPITETALGQGEVAVGLSTSGSALRQLSEAWGDGVLEVGQPLMHKEQVAGGGVAGYGISGEAEDKDAATAWVQYITSPEITTAINEASGYLAPRQSIEGIHADDPILGEVENQLQYVRTWPSLLGGRQIVEDALAPEIQAAVLGQKSAQQALDDAAARASDIINATAAE